MKKLIAANWKMYKNIAEAGGAARKLAELVDQGALKDRDVLVFPPFTAIKAVSEAFLGHSGFFTGGQNFYPAAEGAFTGEISPGMLQDAGAVWVLVGHSERRHIIGESNEFTGRKTSYALNAGLSVVLCVGETLAEREAGELESVLASQLESAFRDVDSSSIDCGRLAVAYEPVWAIGTGKVAGIEEIASAHRLLRDMLNKILPEQGKNIRILYGGSVKTDNAASILSVENVNGVLVGGASLEASSFSKIVVA